MIRRTQKSQKRVQQRQQTGWRARLVRNMDGCDGRMDIADIDMGRVL